MSSITAHIQDTWTDTNSSEPECIDCGHLFDLDTSPDLDRCWMCSEHAEVTQ